MKVRKELMKALLTEMIEREFDIDEASEVLSSIHLLLLADDKYDGEVERCRRHADQTFERYSLNYKSTDFRKE